MRKMKSLLIPIFLVPLVLVGSGYAVFYFGSQQTSADQNVSIDIKDNPDIGTLSLVYHNQDNFESVKNEITECSFKNAILMDIDEVFVIRDDNITSKREFFFMYDKPTGGLASNITVSLYCNVTVEDSDARGVTQVKYDDEGETLTYPSSSSIIDYFSPSHVTNSYTSYNRLFELISPTEDVKTAKKVVYRARLIEEIEKKTATEFSVPYYINFDYNEFPINVGDEIYDVKMAPGDATNTYEYELRIKDAIQSAKNGKVHISFYLVAEEK